MRLRSASAVREGQPRLLKNILIDLADLIAAFAHWRAARWLKCSVWWTDFAESIETGDSIAEIRKQRTDPFSFRSQNSDGHTSE